MEISLPICTAIAMSLKALYMGITWKHGTTVFIQLNFDISNTDISNTDIPKTMDMSK